MARTAVSRMAPGWQEQTAALLPALAREGDGISQAVTLPPGFARIALLVDAAAADDGLRVWVQHSADDVRWTDIAAFGGFDEQPVQIAWLEAQPALSGCIAPANEGGLEAGAVHPGFVCSCLRVRWSASGLPHRFGVEAVAIYQRRDWR